MVASKSNNIVIHVTFSSIGVIENQGLSETNWVFEFIFHHLIPLFNENLGRKFLDYCYHEWTGARITNH